LCVRGTKREKERLKTGIGAPGSMRAWHNRSNLEAEMITAQDAFLIVFGILLCLMGYSMFRGMLPLWGFILGGWIAYTMLPSIVGAERASQLLVQIIGIGIGALIGAAIAIPLYFVIVFLSGAALGMIIGIMLGTLIDIGGVSSISKITAFINQSFPPMPHTFMQFLCMIILGIILGATAIGFQKFMICASSAFIGSAALITGLGGPITNLSATEMGRGAVMVTAWLMIGLIGLFIQFRMMGEV
jgi:hypothetical protein